MENQTFLNKGQKKYNLCNISRCCKIAIIVMSCIFVFFLILGITFAALAAGPLHASCTVKWDIGVNCSAVEMKLIDQMKVWETKDNCEHGGQRCLYKYSKTSGNKIYGTHETPKKHYIDDMTFTLTDAAERCQVQGHSRSQIWYAVLDYGTNYCNIHNLIEGARLNETKSYSESTSDSVCTQYSQSDCDVY